MNTAQSLKAHRAILASLDAERNSWFSHWRTISEYFLPRRYPALVTKREETQGNRRSTKLLDSTSTKALRTLASGMMNGITSPARKWLSLRLEGVPNGDITHEESVWLADSTRRMEIVFAQTNFYNSMAIMFLEYAGFGTASMGMYEDFDDVVRFYNYPVGEFYLSFDGSGRINRHARRFMKSIESVVAEFGLENCSARVQAIYNHPNTARRMEEIEVQHLVEINHKDNLLASPSKYREVYFEQGVSDNYLAVRPLFEWPTATPRWEVHGNDPYGVSPAMDALSEVIMLQEQRMEFARGLEKMVSPPLIVDQSLRGRPTALGARGITYAPNSSANFGAKTAYTVNIPLQELQATINNLQVSIRETLHNPLFNMISQLETVRSATEIDARREEKLIHLGPVLERFYNEGLDPIIKRVFGIMLRNGLFMDAPESLAEKEIGVEYVSILTDAQRASGTQVIERFLAFTGNMAGVYPTVKEIPNVDELMRQYAEGIGIKPTGMHSREEVAEKAAQEANAQAMAQEAAVGKDLAQGAKVLSETDVGGGMNALQQLI